MTEYIKAHVAGPACIPGPVPHWVAVIAPTLGDAVTSVYEGVSGLRAVDPSCRMVQAPGGTVIRWPNGSQAKMYGAHTPEDVERLRSGGNSCCAVLEELAAWRYLDKCFDQLRFGLRSGPHPHWVAATTPKPRELITRIMTGKLPGVVTTHGTIYDNPYLEEEIKAELEEAYAGTDLGEQELYGRLLEQVSQALWKRDVIARNRILTADLPNLSRITVGVDPSGGAGEQGIEVVGKARIPRPDSPPSAPGHLHGYVLDDRTVCLDPDGWGRAVVRAALDWQADDIACEVNYGGDQAIAVIRAAMEKEGCPSIPVRKVTATRGKVVRAQPVAALAAQDRWHHAGVFEELETQLCTWYEDLGWSPDRLDAMVWPGWHLGLVSAVSRGSGSLGGSGMGRSVIPGSRLR